MTFRYEESIGMLYAENTFKFHSMGDITAMACTTLPQRIAAIRSIKCQVSCSCLYHDPIDLTGSMIYDRQPPNDEATWEKGWQILAGMESLQVLHVDIMNLGYQCPLKQAVLEPLRAVSRPKVFEVRLHDSEIEGGLAPWDDAPFSIMRVHRADTMLSD